MIMGCLEVYIQVRALLSISPLYNGRTYNGVPESVHPTTDMECSVAEHEIHFHEFPHYTYGDRASNALHALGQADVLCVGGL